MTEHPLTDQDALREAYDKGRDDQLEQVKARVAAKIADLRQFSGWENDACTLEFYFESILKDLRPQEDN